MLLDRAGLKLTTFFCYDKRRSNMKLHALVLGVALALASGSALAFSCPKHMKAIDAEMAKNPKLTAAQTDDVKKYRAEGETFHKAGKHADALEALGKAEKILGIKT